MFGILSILYGWGYNWVGVELQVVKEYVGVSINDFMFVNWIDQLIGNLVYSGVFVCLEKI